MDRPVSWVLGRGGLLGSSTERVLGRADELWHPGHAFDWTSAEATTQIGLAVDDFTARAEGRPWRIGWCAGAGVVGSDVAALEHEGLLLGTLLTRLGESLEAGRLGRGLLFFASTAGGLYAGSTAPPFDEHTDPRPLSSYGHAKLAQEQMVSRWSAQFGVPSLIGRIANLYGPGQNLSKPQGLISQLCWSQLTQRPLDIYVSLATLRDYLFAPDCGLMIASCLQELAAADRTGELTIVKVLASERPMSIGAVLGEFRTVVKKNPRVLLRASPLGRHQVVDLRLRSSSPIGAGSSLKTPFPVGLLATLLDLRMRYGSAGGGSSSGAHR
jgi:UDP-glucose 4-epimerase